MKRIGFAGVVAGVTGAMLLAAACGGSQDKSGTTLPEEQVAVAEPAPTTPAEPVAPAPAPAPVKLSTAELVRAYQACWNGWLAKDEAKVKACWGAQGTDQMADAGPAATGGEQVATASKEWWTSHADLAGGSILVLAKGNTVVDVSWMGGTQSGPLMGMPASNKKWGGIAGGVAELDDDGTIKATTTYANPLTMLVQLGFVKKVPARPVFDKGPAEPTVVVATGSETETANEAAVRSAIELWNKKDVKAFTALLADDSIWLDQTMPKDVKGKKAVVAMHKELWKAFSDGKVEPTNVWAAGDYVVVEATFSGTNSAASKALGIPKKTGKPVTLRHLHVAKMAGGKIAEYWVFFNGHAMATQLGMVASAAPAEAAPPADKAAPPAKP